MRTYEQAVATAFMNIHEPKLHHGFMLSEATYSLRRLKVRAYGKLSGTRRDADKACDAIIKYLEH